jgi:hypothetical protein
LPKSCIDCKHFIEDEYFKKRKSTGWFTSELVSTTSSVQYGICGIVLEYASVQRKDYSSIKTCGTEGKFWEPKE